MLDDNILMALNRMLGNLPEHVETIHVIESFGGQTVWSGEVHVFAINGHPQATRAYAWSYETDDGRTKTVTVLGVPPINSAQDAVRAAIASGQQD